MPAIYQADIWCDDCADKIRNDIFDSHPDRAQFDNRFEWEVSFGFDDERNYDSDEYPKYCPDDAEADCPQHCADCGDFLENPLTSDGDDYVREAVRADRESGYDDLSEWAGFYDYIDFGPEDKCAVCGDWAVLDENDECENCAEESPEPGWVSDPHFDD